jgi:hypothetical protein
MMRFYFPMIILAGVTSMVACSGRDPVVADEANNAAAAPSDVDVLPPDESVATPTDELGNGDAGDVNVSDADGAGGAIPAAFQGRWGLTPADCTSTRGDNKGLLVVSGDNLRFYEAQARPQGNLKRTPRSVSGEFAFSGEGQNWKKYQVLELQAGKLVRTESDPMASYTYARCTS